MPHAYEEWSRAAALRIQRHTEIRNPKLSSVVKYNPGYLGTHQSVIHPQEINPEEAFLTNIENYLAFTRI